MVPLRVQESERTRAGGVAAVRTGRALPVHRHGAGASAAPGQGSLHLHHPDPPGEDSRRPEGKNSTPIAVAMATAAHASSGSNYHVAQGQIVVLQKMNTNKMMLCSHLQMVKVPTDVRRWAGHGDQDY